MTWNGWRVLVLCLVAAIMSAGVSMAYAGRVARDSERQWCGVVSTLDDAYRETPPRTLAEQRLAADIRRLRSEFDCPRGGN